MQYAGLVIWCLFIFGWCKNIYLLVLTLQVTTTLADTTLLTVLRVVGILLAPLGAVLGYIG